MLIFLMYTTKIQAFVLFYSNEEAKMLYILKRYRQVNVTIKYFRQENKCSYAIKTNMVNRL